ncbi:MAG: hypothetical protein IJM67_01935, partial [Atopobiaceae bacterium]|nr:hypothetical protein [Atopobiaceae bacterium]
MRESSSSASLDTPSSSNWLIPLASWSAPVAAAPMPCARAVVPWCNAEMPSAAAGRLCPNVESAAARSATLPLCCVMPLDIWPMPLLRSAALPDASPSAPAAPASPPWREDAPADAWSRPPAAPSSRPETVEVSAAMPSTAVRASSSASLASPRLVPAASSRS